jgi:penicillin-binding protein-related factor A (putative recombinase)
VTIEREKKKVIYLHHSQPLYATMTPDIAAGGKASIPASFFPEECQLIEVRGRRALEFLQLELKLLIQTKIIDGWCTTR